MKYLPLFLMLTLPLAHATDDGEDTPLIINGCTVAQHSQCPGADLKGANLSNQDLRSMNLSGADLRNADLRHARLDLANLEKARLQGANLTRASLQQSNLRLADFTGATLMAIQGWGMFAQGAQFQDANMEGCTGCPTTWGK